MKTIVVNSRRQYPQVGGALKFIFGRVLSASQAHRRNPDLGGFKYQESPLSRAQDAKHPFAREESAPHRHCGAEDKF